MAFRLSKWLRKIRSLMYFILGVLVVLVVIFVLYLNRQADLSVWHLANLDEEFTVTSKVENFEQYLALEDRLFKQLDDEVYAEIEPEEQQLINRYHRGSLSDPDRWSPNWNRSFVLPNKTPKAGVLLLHGLSDSPYSLRHFGERFNAAGALVMGLRIPGHGTAPSGLLDVTWQDMAAAVRLAMRHLAEKTGDQPLYIVGYSNGAALAVHYALSTLDDVALPKIKRVVVLSPEIGVTSAAALAIWQSRLGHILGLEKLAWTSILPEYDPFKYGSFAVNAGNVAYQLTKEIQQRITALKANGKLAGFPSILAFSSVVDATVSTPALIDGLFQRLPAGDHELVLFDINNVAEMTHLLKWNPAAIIASLKKNKDWTFTFNLVTNQSPRSLKTVVRSMVPGKGPSIEIPTGLSWPADIYSLSHVALPFPADDPVYGGHPEKKSVGIHLGDIALRGEKGILRVPASDMLRQRWNPFYPYVEQRVMKFLELSTTPQE